MSEECPLNTCSLYFQCRKFIKESEVKRVPKSRDTYTPEDRSDRFSRNAQATNWIQVTKTQFGVLYIKSLTRRFVL